MRKLLTTLAAVGLAVPALAIDIDGLNIQTEFPPAIAVQDTNTQFGDATAMGPGNELDTLHVDADANDVFLGLTGNIADNNALTIFIDTDLGGANGQSTISAVAASCPGEIPRVVQTYTDTVMETGFLPDYALLISVGIFPGQSTSQLVFASDLVDLNAGTNTVIGLGFVEAPVNPGAVSGTSGVRIAIDNSNVDGVGTWDIGAETPDLTGDDPLSATSGFEIAIPRALLGLDGLAMSQDIGIQAIISDNATGGCAGNVGPCGADGFASNQLLPGVAGNGNLMCFSPSSGFFLDFTSSQGPNTDFATATIAP